MGAWPGKFVIGLTGNIATGKSVVRKMLEHLGAYGIDADSLANRAIAKGSPAYQPVLEAFGRWILGPDEQIDRAKLGRLVFSDPDALQTLESIVHPMVRQAIDILVRRAKHSIVVIEAIKLIESGLAEKCDSLWVTYTPPELQLARLTQKRGMAEAQARQRMNAQNTQDKKVSAADVVIRNQGSYEDTWGQVMAAWYRLFPAFEEETPEPVATVSGDVTIQRARPRDAQEVADLITQLSAGKRKATRHDIMATFGEKAYLILKIDGKAHGLVGWKVENLVARTDDIFIDSSLHFTDAMRLFLNEIERVSRELQCEISLLFLPNEASNQESALTSLGYQRKAIPGLGVRAWEEAALESMPGGSFMLFKQLRQDRVLRPV
jgi:dephospho-CoA kinase